MEEKLKAPEWETSLLSSRELLFNRDLGRIYRNNQRPHGETDSKLNFLDNKAREVGLKRINKNILTSSLKDPEDLGLYRIVDGRIFLSDKIHTAASISLEHEEQYNSTWTDFLTLNHLDEKYIEYNCDCIDQRKEPKKYRSEKQKQLQNITVYPKEEGVYNSHVKMIIKYKGDSRENEKCQAPYIYAREDVRVETPASSKHFSSVEIEDGYKITTMESFLDGIQVPCFNLEVSNFEPIEVFGKYNILFQHDNDVDDIYRNADVELIELVVTIDYHRYESIFLTDDTFILPTNFFNKVNASFFSNILLKEYGNCNNIISFFKSNHNIDKDSYRMVISSLKLLLNISASKLKCGERDIKKMTECLSFYDIAVNQLETKFRELKTRDGDNDFSEDSSSHRQDSSSHREKNCIFFNMKYPRCYRCNEGIPNSGENYNSICILCVKLGEIPITSYPGGEGKETDIMTLAGFIVRILNETNKHYPGCEDFDKYITSSEDGKIIFKSNNPGNINIKIDLYYIQKNKKPDNLSIEWAKPSGKNTSLYESTSTNTLPYINEKHTDVLISNKENSFSAILEMRCRSNFIIIGIEVSFKYTS